MQVLGVCLAQSPPYALIDLGEATSLQCWESQSRSLEGSCGHGWSQYYMEVSSYFQVSMHHILAE